jgi:hypothetical protein
MRVGGDMNGPAVEEVLIDVCGAGNLEESPNKRRRDAASVKNTNHKIQNETDQK